MSRSTLAGVAVTLASLAALGVAVGALLLEAIEEALSSTDNVPWDDEHWD